MAGNLNGLVALVTGGSRGIGAAIAKRLGEEGATVGVNYVRSDAAAKDVTGSIEAAGGKAGAFQADVAKEADADRLVAEVIERFGKVDILVNNAGVFDMAPLEGSDRAFTERQFAINVFGLLSVTRAATPHLPDGRGRVINISSVVGDGQSANGSVYWATKAAVNSITRSLAIELGPRGITVNAVSPGLTETDMIAGAEEMIDATVAATPLGRLGAPGDIAGPVAYVASEDAGWITGQAIHVSGGLRT